MKINWEEQIDFWVKNMGEKYGVLPYLGFGIIFIKIGIFPFFLLCLLKNLAWAEAGFLLGFWKQAWWLDGPGGFAGPDQEEVGSRAPGLEQVLGGWVGSGLLDWRAWMLDLERGPGDYGLQKLGQLLNESSSSKIPIFLFFLFFFLYFKNQLSYKNKNKLN